MTLQRTPVESRGRRVPGLYARKTGHPGGVKQRTAGAILDGKFPERVLEKAVERMIPEGPLGRKQLKNLRVYSGKEHPHAAQSPETIDIAALSRKNQRAA